MSGLVVCVVVLAAAAVFGAFWRRRNGVLRVVRADPQIRQGEQGQQGEHGPQGHPGQQVPRSARGIGGVAGAGFGAGAEGGQAAGAARRAGVITAAQLGRPLGSRATLVQFSTAFCAPCRATRRVLADVAGMVDGVVHVEVDAEANLGLVRSLGIHSTPTVFVLGADGTILRRGTGQPRKPDVIAALGRDRAARPPKTWIPRYDQPGRSVSVGTLARLPALGFAGCASTCLPGTPSGCGLVMLAQMTGSPIERGSDTGPHHRDAHRG